MQYFQLLFYIKGKLHILVISEIYKCASPVLNIPYNSTPRMNLGHSWHCGGLRMCHPRAARRHFLILNFVMSNCSQNCWIDLNSAVLCFQRHFHTGVWTFAWFVRPLLATILCVWESWFSSNNRVYMYHVFHWLKPERKKITKKMRVTATILKPTYDQKPETFCLALLCCAVNAPIKSRYI